MSKNINAFNDELAKEMQKATEELRKCFDSVTIFATRHIDDETGTTRFSETRGNYFASFGYIQMWVNEQKITQVKDETE